MGKKQDHAIIKKTHESINTNRNERQKAILLIEVAHDVCAKSARLCERTCQLIAQAASLHKYIGESNKRRV